VPEKSIGESCVQDDYPGWEAKELLKTVCADFAAVAGPARWTREGKGDFVLE